MTSIDERFRIVPAHEVQRDAILELMNEAFERQLSLDWYRWKHEEGPWGSSRGWVAVRDKTVLGVRLFTPWRMTGLGAWFEVVRAFDGAVSTEARRQGVFSSLVRVEMDRLAARGQPQLILSTSVPASRAAYSRLGWWGFEVPHLAAPVQLVRNIGVSAGPARTDWSPAAWRWRLDPRSGHDYKRDGGRNDDAPALVYRVERRRRGAILVIIHCAPAPDAASRIRSAAKQERCRWVMGAGLGPWRARDVGRSLVTGWNTGEAVEPDRLHLELADLEGVL